MPILALQEACAAENTTDFRAAQTRLQHYTDALKYLHYTLVLGSEAQRVTGEHHPMHQGATCFCHGQVKVPGMLA